MCFYLGYWSGWGEGNWLVRQGCGVKPAWGPGEHGYAQWERGDQSRLCRPRIVKLKQQEPAGQGEGEE